MTKICELIDIATDVQAGDFVLKLNQGITGDTTRTVDDYVVTEQLAAAFDEALGLIASAVSDNESKAAFLQGSFGAGKSHFMAMLHLLLSNDPHARAKPELQQSLNRCGPQLDGKKFLLVPVHFLAAKSTEQKILGGYVERIEELNPGGALPGVYLGDEIMATELRKLRAQFGDEAVLKGLNSADGGDDEWGQVAAKNWTVDSVDEALNAPATDQRRLDLVAAFVAAYRPGTMLQTAVGGEGFVDLDRGLGAISRHAARNGYDGVVLFLDELILWLASHIADLGFVQAESQKLIKLVEAGDAGRPVPIISFVARQRDLKELVGEAIAGNQQKAFADTQAWQDGRFGRIKLEAGNLALVAQKRLLKPVDDNAGRELAAALDEALAGRDDIKKQLLGSAADIGEFRATYPFSPALVQVLVDVSEALQRERTALKLMQQLLVDQRETLEVGQIIPVGDLWDVVATAAEPFSAELKTLFDCAEKLWRTRLAPALAASHNVTGDTPADAPQRQALANDERLLKTVLLAALVPEVEAFRGLNAARLVALNWGTITTPIPGQETHLVAEKLRTLAGQVAELLIGDDSANPTVAIKLANVDIEDIIARAANSFDNPGARRQKLQTLIASAVGNSINDERRGTLEHHWRGTKRPVDVIFGNVRDTSEMADQVLIASPDRPKLIIDFPLDDQGHSPADDLARLDDWSHAHASTPTVCWLPSFFNDQGLIVLKRYVAVDEVLKLDRLGQYTTQLSATQRAEAKPLLESTRRNLKEQLHDAILCAYGIVSETHPLVDSAQALTDHFRSLDPTLAIAAPTKPSFGEALNEVCDQIFATLYPGHPKFGAAITNASLRTTWREIKRALADPDGRITVEAKNRLVLGNVAQPMKLGKMYDSHFILGNYWFQKLDPRLAGSATQAITVDDMRAHIDTQPGGPLGLEPQVADLIILTVAAQTDHRLTHRGSVLDPDQGKSIVGDAVLELEQLPDADQWKAAVERAATIFGRTFMPKVTGPEMVSMGTYIQNRAKDLVTPVDDLVDQLTKAYKPWGLTDGKRLATARAGQDLVRACQRVDDATVVKKLADFRSPTSDAATAKSLTSAAHVAKSVGGANLDLWVTARSAVEEQATKALVADEIVVAFEPAAMVAEAAATAHVAANQQAAAPPADGGRPEGKRVSLRSPKDLDPLIEQLSVALGNGDSLEVTWRLLGPGP